ncbi:hypothetical protein OPQ81_006875 [Rhizoctonia solani]|nr:hypothetical protein OPQ81_006875 [Rhizoctonia solani]
MALGRGLHLCAVTQGHTLSPRSEWLPLDFDPDQENIMKDIALLAIPLLVALGVDARPQEESSVSVFPLPTIVPNPPSISSGFPPLPTSTPFSLTPRPPMTTSQPSTTPVSSATGVSSTSTGQTTRTSASASVTSPIASVTSALSSLVSSASTVASASASATNNAAPAHFEPLKVHGLAALGVVTAVFASMLFAL